MPSSAWSLRLKGQKLADEGIRAPFPAFTNLPRTLEAIQTWKLSR